MRYEEMEMNWATSSEPDTEEDEEGLDNSELRRLQFFSERLELTDPVIWFLPQVRAGRRRR